MCVRVSDESAPLTEIHSPSTWKYTSLVQRAQGRPNLSYEYVGNFPICNVHRRAMPIYSAFTAAEKMAFISAMLSNSWLAEFFYVGGPDSKLDCTFRLHFQGLRPILISGCAKLSFSGFFFW